MCEKPFNSALCNFAFFLIASGGLVATSGVALRLGGFIMSKHEPKNMEYPFYAAESGFFIGAKSAAFFQWMTAGFVTLFAKINASYFEKRLCDRIFVTYLQNFFLVVLFGAFHYFSLPVCVRDELNCLNIQKQLTELNTQNPLCEVDHPWASLFTAFSMGSSICFVGCLLLQTIYLCLRAVCETEITPNTEPAVEAPVVVAATPAFVTISP